MPMRDRAADGAVSCRSSRPRSRSAWRSTCSGFSISVAVGQTSMQAPQKSQFDSWTGPPAPKAMRVLKPRPASVIAPVWRISSQARTQRVQMMHICGSNSRKGLARSASGCSDSVVGALLADPGLVVGHLEHLVRRLQLAAVVLRAGEAAVRDRRRRAGRCRRAAVDAAVAGEAAVRVVGVDEREHGLARVLERRGGLGADDHAVGDARRCRRAGRPRAPSISTRQVRQPA